MGMVTQRYALFCATVSLFLVASTTAATPAACAQQPITVGLLSRQSVAVDLLSGKAYAVDSRHNAVLVASADASRSIRSVSVGAAPVAIAIDSAHARVYVANNGGATVSVLDASTDAVVQTVAVGLHPYALAVDAEHQQVYVARTFSNSLTLIDGVSGHTSTLAGASADAMVVEQARHALYLLNYEAGDLLVVHTETHAIQRVPLGKGHSWGIAADADAGLLYITHPVDNQVTALHPETAAATSIPVGRMPSAVATDPSLHRMYVANYLDDDVWVLDSDTHRLIAKVPTGPRPQALAVDYVAHSVFVAMSGSAEVAVLDGSTGALQRTLAVGSHPYALAVDAARRTLYVSNELGPPLSVVPLGLPGRPRQR